MAAIATLNTKSRIFRDREEIVIKIAATAPGSNSTYDALLPPGFYRLAVTIKEAVTGTTTDLTMQRLISPQAGGTPVVGGANLSTYISSATGGAILAIVSIDGATNQIFQILAATDINVTPTPIAVDAGIRFTLVNGTAVAGEVMELTLIATRIG